MTGVSREQREILGPAWDLQTAIGRAEKQWRESHPELAMVCEEMRAQLVREVNVELVELGGATLAKMPERGGEGE